MLVRRVLVVDGQTAIGPAMLDALARGGYDARLTTRAELEADDRRACRSALSALEPNVLIDCTADETVGLGFDAGAGNLAAATRVMGGLSVFVSDAEVFDGAAAAPYVESSTAAPATSRGATILAAEREVARANPRHALVRTSWLFGSAASGFVDDLLAAADTSDELSLDATVMSSPTYAPHLAESMLGLLRQPAYGVFHRAAAGSCTRLELARTLLSMIETTANAVAADEAPEPALRLVLESLRTELPALPHWRIGLTNFIRAREATTRPAA